MSAQSDARTDALAAFGLDVLRALESDLDSLDLADVLVDRAVALDLGTTDMEGFSRC